MHSDLRDRRGSAGKSLHRIGKRFDIEIGELLAATGQVDGEYRRADAGIRKVDEEDLVEAAFANEFGR